MSNIIKDVFKDYKEENNIIYAEVENINLFKKSKKIEISLKTKKTIKICEISSFEDYLKNRFQIQNVSINIEKVEKEDLSIFPDEIQKDWKDIVDYLSKNFPLTKTILKSSTIKIVENRIIVELKTKSADFLHSYKIDEEIEHIVSNLYGIKCKVEYREDVTEDTIKEQEEYLNSLEKIACDDLMYEINVQNEIAKEMEQKEVEEEQNKEDGKLPLIFGRTDKIKDQIVKISDLTTDYGKVAIEGKVISVDSRELKNGKTLAMFNIYDGTSTITCKSFIEQDKVEQVMRKIKRSKKT